MVVTATASPAARGWIVVVVVAAAPATAWIIISPCHSAESHLSFDKIMLGERPPTGARLRKHAYSKRYYPRIQLVH